MPHRFKVGDKVRIVRPPVVRHTWGGAAYEATIPVPHDYTIIELIECNPPQYYVSGTEPVIGRRTERMWVFEHMLDPCWVDVPGGAKYRINLDGQALIRSFHQDWTPKQLAAALCNAKQGDVDLSKSTDSLIVGKFGDKQFVMLRME